VLFRDEFGGIVALARLLGSDDPENTAQEAFLRLHTRWASLRDPAAALAYLRTTVVRLARNRVRHLTVVRRHAAAAPPGEHPSAESDALQQADIQAVRSALDRLTARRRAALVLRYYAELPYQEIATALRCPAATARSHVRRGLAELAHLLGEPNEPENKDGGERS
jgi:RNA polymerase sigma factor (sigma-70 family)